MCDCGPVQLRRTLRLEIVFRPAKIEKWTRRKLTNLLVDPNDPATGSWPSRPAKEVLGQFSIEHFKVDADVGVKGPWLRVAAVLTDTGFQQEDFLEHLAKQMLRHHAVFHRLVVSVDRGDSIQLAMPANLRNKVRCFRGKAFVSFASLVKNTVHSDEIAALLRKSRKSMSLRSEVVVETIPLKNQQVRSFRAATNAPREAPAADWLEGTPFALLSQKEQDAIIQDLVHSKHDIASYYHLGPDLPDVALLVWDLRVCAWADRPRVQLTGCLLDLPDDITATSMAQNIAGNFQHWMASGDFQISLASLQLGSLPPRLTAAQVVQLQTSLLHVR